MRKDNKEFPIKSLDQIRLSREELAPTQIENVLKHNLDVTGIPSSDETPSTWQMNNNCITMNQSMLTNRKSFHMKSQNLTNSPVIFWTQTNTDSELW